jgi:hypothetical protein
MLLQVVAHSLDSRQSHIRDGETFWHKRTTTPRLQLRPAAFHFGIADLDPEMILKLWEREALFRNNLQQDSALST